MSEFLSLNERNSLNLVKFPEFNCKMLTCLQPFFHFTSNKNNIYNINYDYDG